MYNSRGDFIFQKYIDIQGGWVLTNNQVKILGAEIGKEIAKEIRNYLKFRLILDVKGLGQTGAYDSIIHQLGEAIGRGLKMTEKCEMCEYFTKIEKPCHGLQWGEDLSGCKNFVKDPTCKDSKNE